MGHSENFLIISSRIIENLMVQFPKIDRMIDIVDRTRTRGGRLFIIGMGGSAGNASHAVNDFRKLCDIEAYAPTDNVPELTARANDEGLDTIFSGWLKVSQLNSDDCLFILSVGGGNVEKGVSLSIINAISLAKERNARIIGIVGRDGGATAKYADACVIVPTIDANFVTPQTEAMQAVIWHLMVSSPKLQEHKTKW
jgi:D-sedoheptulose 7-phosphate isomerase